MLERETVVKPGTVKLDQGISDAESVDCVCAEES